MKKSVKAVLGVALALLLLVLSTGTASAVTTKQFTLVSDPATAQVTYNLHNPPLPLVDSVVIHENVKTPAGVPAGTADLNCTVAGFVPSPAALLLACTAKFNLTDGSLTGTTAFLTTQHEYPAAVVGTSGAYTGYAGTAQISDRAPGDETYAFTLTHL